MISFIIPAKNEYQHLKKVLPHLVSSANKSCMSYEIILIDNGSTDGTKQIGMEYGCEVLVSNVGSVASLRNLGASKANGGILCFLDADCVVTEDWVKSCLDCFDRDSSIRVVGSPAIADMVNGTWVERSITTIMAASPRPDRPLWIGTSNLFVRKEVFLAVGGFDVSLVTSEDYDFCIRVNDTGARIFLNKKETVLHLGESKTLCAYFKKEFWRGSGQKIESIYQLFSNRYNQFIITNLIFNLLFLFGINIGWYFSSLFFIIVLFMPLFYIILKLKKVPLKADIIVYYAVSWVYLSSRSLAFLNLLFNHLQKSARRKQ